MKCENCSHLNKSSAKFCAKCGKTAIKIKFFSENILYFIPLIIVGLYFLFTGSILSVLLIVGIIFIWHPNFKKIIKNKDNLLIKKLGASLVILIIAFLITDDRTDESISLINNSDKISSLIQKNESQIENETMTIEKKNVELENLTETIAPIEEIPLTLNDTSPYEEVFYSDQDYSLTNSFMNYNLGWIKEINFVDYTRVRIDDNNSLNSFIFTNNQQAKIVIQLKNDCYDIKTYHGDPSYPQGPHFIKIEGKVLNENLYTQKGEFKDFNTSVCIKNNILRITLGKNYTDDKENYDFDNIVGYSMLNVLAIKQPKANKWYYINFGAEQNNDLNKTRFLINGFEENPKNCVSTFLQKTKCQSNAVMKEFQKSNCEVIWALFEPCNNSCEESICVK